MHANYLPFSIAEAIHLVISYIFIYWLAQKSLQLFGAKVHDEISKGTVLRRFSRWFNISMRYQLIKNNPTWCIDEKNGRGKRNIGTFVLIYCANDNGCGLSHWLNRLAIANQLISH